MLVIINSIICRPLNIKTHIGMEYFIMFIDNHSRYGYIYLINKKSQPLDKFKGYKSEVKTQLEGKIKTLLLIEDVNIP